jgi:hypothetical protein
MTKRLSRVLSDLEAAGIQVEIGDDFSKYQSYRNRQLDRGPIYPMFDVASSYIDHTNGFWVCGFNQNGDLIHTQAVRVLNLSGTSLGSHLDTHRHKYITPNSTPDPDLTYYSGPEALQTITGRICYHGDFWLRAHGLGGPRSQGATALLSRVLLELMNGTWNPSFVFALVPKQLASKGAHLRYGYSHCEPGQWLGPDGQVTEEDYLIWMSASDMHNLLAREPQALQRVADRPKAKPPAKLEGANDVVDITANA